MTQSRRIHTFACHGMRDYEGVVLVQDWQGQWRSRSWGRRSFESKDKMLAGIWFHREGCFLFWTLFKHYTISPAIVGEVLLKQHKKNSVHFTWRNDILGVYGYLRECIQ